MNFINRKLVSAKRARWTCALLAVALPTMTLAHHGTSITYDVNKTITVTGTVTQFFWGFPHVQIYLDQMSDKGQVLHWGIEMAPTPTMLKRLNAGWNRSIIKAGDMITIVCNPHKVTGVTACLAKKISVNGKDLVLGGPPPPSTPPPST